MTATVVLTAASRRRWLARRRKGLTATDVPAILGLSPWKTGLDVWLDKVDPRDTDATYPMRRGRALEPVIADQWQADHGGWVERPPLLVAHPEHPWLLASLDRLWHTRDETVALEIKTSTRWQEWADGDAPDVYAAQALTQAAVTGLPVLIVADVNGRLEERRIDPQPAWEADTLPLLHDWWTTYVLGRTPPPLHEWRDYPLLQRLWMPDPDTTMEATDAVMCAVKAYAGLQARAKQVQPIKDALRTTIRAHMATATTLTDPDDPDVRVARITKAGALIVDWKPTEKETDAA